MMILIGFLLAVICVLLCVLWKYKRQINDICRQLRFLKEHDSNMMITTDFSKGSFAELSTVLNDFLADQKEERKSYRKKEQAISDTYTNLSHDIRTPLTSLDGYFQLLETSDNEDDRRRYVAVIQERIDNLKEMLEELFTYTKLQNESYSLPLEPIQWNRIVKEVMFSYYDTWMQQEISPQFQLTEEPLCIFGNPQALQRIIQNVLKNALDHGEKEVFVQLEKKGSEAHLTIQNKVSQEVSIDTERIFERFYKADEARSKNSTGLGLAIAKEFVLKMNGKIAARKNGTLFEIIISFPLYNRKDMGV